MQIRNFPRTALLMQSIDILSYDGLFPITTASGIIHDIVWIVIFFLIDKGNTNSAHSLQVCQCPMTSIWAGGCKVTPSHHGPAPISLPLRLMRHVLIVHHRFVTTVVGSRAASIVRYAALGGNTSTSNAQNRRLAIEPRGQGLHSSFDRTNQRQWIRRSFSGSMSRRRYARRSSEGRSASELYHGFVGSKGRDARTSDKR